MTAYDVFCIGELVTARKKYSNGRGNRLPNGPSYIVVAEVDGYLFVDTSHNERETYRGSTLYPQTQYVWCAPSHTFIHVSGINDSIYWLTRRS